MPRASPTGCISRRIGRAFRSTSAERDRARCRPCAPGKRPVVFDVNLRPTLGLISPSTPGTASWSDSARLVKLSLDDANGLYGPQRHPRSRDPDHPVSGPGRGCAHRRGARMLVRVPVRRPRSSRLSRSRPLSQPARAMRSPRRSSRAGRLASMGSPHPRGCALCRGRRRRWRQRARGMGWVTESSAARRVPCSPMRSRRTGMVVKSPGDSSGLTRCRRHPIRSRSPSSASTCAGMRCSCWPVSSRGCSSLDFLPDGSDSIPIGSSTPLPGSCSSRSSVPDPIMSRYARDFIFVSAGGDQHPPRRALVPRRADRRHGSPSRFFAAVRGSRSSGGPTRSFRLWRWLRPSVAGGTGPTRRRSERQPRLPGVSGSTLIDGQRSSPDVERFHPTFLYESLFNLANAAVLSWVALAYHRIRAASPW